jgi:regulator of protease activity HflC (stomatin/prohibitin superfamily)
MLSIENYLNNLLSVNQSMLQQKTIVKLIIAFIVIIVVLIFNPFVTVGASERGIVLNWGAADDKVLEPGLHFRIPVQQHIKLVSIQPIQLDHEVIVGGDGAITKDNQTIGADLTVFYKYKPDQIVKMYREYGADKLNAIISQTLRESFKTEIGNYDIFKLPTVQEEIRGKVWGVLLDKMKDYPVELTELKVVNYDWSDQFDAQIQETMSRAQQVKQKEQEKLMAEQEAGKGIVQSEANKKIAITNAEGEQESARLRAEAKALEGEGIKKYNESISKNMDQEIRFRQLEIEKIKAEKWNGQYVPNNMYGPIPVDTTGGIK